MSETASPRRRRRSKTNEMVTIYWRDIPAQVTATCAGEKGSWLLEERFQVAIDRAAGVAGLTNADDYVLQWRREAQPCDGDPEATARAEAERLQGLYDRDRVQALIDTGGLDPETNPVMNPTLEEPQVPTTNPQHGALDTTPTPEQGS